MILQGHFDLAGQKTIAVAYNANGKITNNTASVYHCTEALTMSLPVRTANIFQILLMICESYIYSNASNFNAKMQQGTTRS